MALDPETMRIPKCAACWHLKRGKAGMPVVDRRLP